MNQQVFKAILLCFLFNLGLEGVAQKDSTSSQIYIGLDLGKTIFLNVVKPTSRGFNIEIPARFQVGKKVSVSASLGYTSLAIDTLHKNTDYKSKGFFGKLGVEHAFGNDNFSLGASAVFGSYTNSGTFRIKGDYFDDYTQAYSHYAFSVAFQTYFFVKIPISHKFSLGLTFHQSYILSPLAKNSLRYISWYMPGVGIHGRTSFSTGLSLHAYYQLSTK